MNRVSDEIARNIIAARLSGAARNALVVHLTTQLFLHLLEGRPAAEIEHMTEEEFQELGELALRAAKPLLAVLDKLPGV